MLGFYEMREEDRPPESIWLNVEELNAHFDRIKRDSQQDGHEEVPDLQQNELTKGLR